VALSRRSTRPRYALLLLVLASVSIITLDYRGSGAVTAVKTHVQDALTPVQAAVSGALRPVGNFFEGAVSYGSLQSENARLRAENARLRGPSLRASAEERQTQQLMAQANLPFVPTIPKVVAEVIGPGPSNFEDTVEISKGTSAGARVGNPVVTGAGLVGRVVAASGNRATVILVSDPTSHIGVRFGPHGDLGIVNGEDAGQPLGVDMVPLGAQVTKGEVMTTSGVGQSIYPGGIPVGTVASNSASAGALQRQVTLSPVANLGQLDLVSVLQWVPTTGTSPR